jgi:hypothetical protein
MMCHNISQKIAKGAIRASPTVDQLTGKEEHLANQEEREIENSAC